jgi:hypothetical protein
MDAQPLAGGRTSGAARRGDTVIRPGGAWTPTVHAVLEYLAHNDFQGAPRPLGFDEDGNEVLSHLDGQTIGDSTPWPAWIYSDSALVQTGRWLRRLHDATRSFVPAADAIWFTGHQWSPGMVIGHHDAAPYNAVWRDDTLVGFIDWDTAGPSTPDRDLAFTALTWIPLITRRAAQAQGFGAFDDRQRRLHLLLDAYGFDGDRTSFGQTVVNRAMTSATIIRRLADTGNPIFVALTDQADNMEQAAADISALPPQFWTSHITDEDNRRQ